VHRRAFRPCGPRGRGRPLPARLFWRVYLNGLLLLALVALTVFITGVVLGHAPPGRSPERFAAYAATRIDELRDKPGRLQRELQRVHDTFGAAVTVYVRGVPVASNVDPPLAPVDPSERAQLPGGPFQLHGRRWSFAAPLSGEPEGYVVLTGAVPSPPLLRAATFLLAVLLALALGSIPLARAIASPLERLGRAVRSFGAGDLSARARLQARGEVGEVAEAFDQMADRIEGLLRGEKELLANISHELRTPLSRIRVALELAAEGDAEKARRYLGEIGSDLDELTRLVEDVLTAARLDLAAGRGGATELPLRRERVEGRELVLAAAERFRAAHPNRALQLEVADPLPAVEADPALLRRVLDNLLDNARKYSDDGSAITLTAAAEDGALAVEVADQGIGLGPADLQQLFTPFFRSDRSRARGTGGVGLGLALAKRVVEAHGGRIGAESAAGGGTRFRFSVPAAS
jgi:signal transduction histidine kinase